MDLLRGNEDPNSHTSATDLRELANKLGMGEYKQFNKIFLAFWHLSYVFINVNKRIWIRDIAKYWSININITIQSKGNRNR